MEKQGHLAQTILCLLSTRALSAQKTLSATQIKQKYFAKNCMRVSLEIKPVMLPFFTSFEIDKEKRTLKPYGTRESQRIKWIDVA